jgi:RND family efflux transporter MFP subunit
MKMKAKACLGSFLALAILASCGPTASQSPVADKSIAVRTAKVYKAENSSVLHYSGTLEASRSIPLSFQSAGTIEKIYVETGDAVKKGQLLATVDNTDMQNIYRAAVATYEQAKDAHDRLKSVHENGSLPEIKWVEMETSLEKAKSSMEIAKNNLEKCNMRAPVSGVVGRRNIEPGQSSVGTAISPIELVQLETVLVRISVPENEISRIVKGQTTGFSVAALDGKQFEGTVHNISPVADLLSRTYTVKI